MLSKAARAQLLRRGLGPLLVWLGTAGAAACGARSELEVGECVDQAPRCVLGFEECDGRADNGCETWIEGDDANCGACGVACPSGTFCAQGRCEEPDTVVQVLGGFLSTCARRAGGQVLCWGSNEHGQLGSLDAPSTSTPTPVPGVSDATALFGGGGGTWYCATRRGGLPVCWGGEHGLAEVPPIEDLAALAPRGEATCALLTTGRVRCWGSNADGLLGDGTFEDSAAPVLVLEIDDAVDILGNCVLRRDGSVWCWGESFGGGMFPLDYINTGKPEDLGVHRTAGTEECGQAFRRLLRGSASGGAIDGRGGVVLWGASAPPVVARDITDVSEAADAEGGVGPCFLSRGGDMTCWRSYSYGGGFAQQSSGGFDAAGIRQLSGGFNHACAVLLDGTVSCWGDNDEGQLGRGDVEESITPVVVETE